MVTAHPNPPDVNGFEIMGKPFDLEHLVATVRQRLDSTWRRPQLPTGGGTASKRPGDGSEGDCPDQVELILYVSSDSPRSAQAIDNIKRIVARFASNRVKLTMCELAKNPSHGASDATACTPILLKRSPGPRTFILGHITNADMVSELLKSCGEEAL